MIEAPIDGMAVARAVGLRRRAFATLAALRAVARVDPGLPAPKKPPAPRRSLMEQFRARLAACTTEDDVALCLFHLASSPLTQGCSSGTIRKYARVAQDRIDAIRATASVVAPVIEAQP